MCGRCLAVLVNCCMEPGEFLKAEGILFGFISRVNHSIWFLWGISYFIKELLVLFSHFNVLVIP